MQNRQLQEVLATAEAKLVDLLVDDITWRCATRARREEWLQSVGELTEEGLFAAPVSPLRCYVTVEADGLRLVFHSPRGSEVGRLELPRATVAPLLREYFLLLQAIGTQGAAGYSPQVEALDIARRLLHNDAGELLMQHAVGVLPTHQTARLLFTLLLLLTHDTTKLQLQ